jgi:Fe-S oxidoreductase
MSKNYFDHKETIEKFSKVLVTGPHGAGNKITAYIIDADYENLEHTRWEDMIATSEDLSKILQESDNYVTFCPSCSGHLHNVIEDLEDVLVIFTYKNMDEIKSYRHRNNIIQSIDAYEEPVYERVINEDCPDLGYSLEDGLEEVTYGVWENFQRELIPNWIEVEHSSLSKHWKWVPKEKRSDFKEWQTEIGEKP